MNFTLMVCKVIGSYSGDKPYHLIEVYTTSEGNRTRICDGRWETEEAAEAARLTRITDGPTAVLQQGAALLKQLTTK